MNAVRATEQSVSTRFTILFTNTLYYGSLVLLLLMVISIILSLFAGLMKISVIAAGVLPKLMLASIAGFLLQGLVKTAAVGTPFIRKTRDA